MNLAEERHSMETNTDRLRLIFHGAVVVLIGLLAGLPTVVESINGAERFWHTAHEALIMIGIYILAASAVVPVLVLERRENSFLVWAYLAMGYGFVIALVMGGIVGANAFEPGGTPIRFIAFLAAVIGIAGAFLATGLTIIGARTALKRLRKDGS
jgi:hypothetical protein